MSKLPNERTAPQMESGSKITGQEIKSTVVPAVDIARSTHEVITESSATGWCLGCEETFTATGPGESHVRETGHPVRLESASLSWLVPGAGDAR